MNTTLILLYLLISIITFVCIVLHERREMYIDKEALFLMMMVSLVWPLSTAFAIIFSSFSWLEKVVNKGASK